jgi:glutathione S-transferase
VGFAILKKGFTIVDRWLSVQVYVTGRFGIANAALFYVAFWVDKTDVPLPPNYHVHYLRMMERPVVRQVLMEEGYGRATSGGHSLF